MKMQGFFDFSGDLIANAFGWIFSAERAHLGRSFAQKLRYVGQA